MLGSKEYIGLALDGDTIKVAQVAVDGKKLRLVKLDQYSLAQEIGSSGNVQGGFEDDTDFGEELDADSIFGLDDSEPSGGNSIDLDLEEDISFDDLAGAGEPEEDVLALDMVEESDSAQSNEMLLYNIFSDVSSQKVNIGINVPAGNAIFQILKDINYKEAKTKDLVLDVEEKLESIHGTPRTKDNYGYEVRDDGSLLIASVDEEAPLLRLLNNSLDLYKGNVIVDEVLPDEAILAGLVRANYVFPEYEITGIVQFGSKKCRIIFLKGNKILQVSPIINEGTKNKSFLNTVFSKILFQLDTGEIPNLDRILIANNTLGGEAIEFFKKSFSDIAVSEFEYDQDRLDFGGLDSKIVNSFTTAIGSAWAASGADKDAFPKLSMLPSYVEDRQKIFKLQWHGIMVLLLIFLCPIAINHFYQKYSNQITNLSSDLEYTNLRIAQIQPIVESTNQLKDDLSLLKEKLVLLDTLSKGSREWSTNFDTINEGMRGIGNTWLTSMRQASGGVVLEGYTLFRNRIPRVVNIFDEATLMNVSIHDVREKEVFRFSIMVKDFVEDKSLYSPPVPDEIKEIIAN